jgi:small subunit ribosomal protein S1
MQTDQNDPRTAQEHAPQASPPEASTGGVAPATPPPNPAPARPEGIAAAAETGAVVGAVTGSADPQTMSAAAAHTLSSEQEAEIDAAMQSLGLAPVKGKAPPGHAVPPGVNPAPAKLRGPRQVQSGREHRKGFVVSVGPNDIFVEFGPKELGVLERAALPEGTPLPEVKSEIEVVVERRDNDSGLFLCSLPGMVRKADWEMLEPGQVIEARVSGVNKGGLELEVAGHRAFMPAGQVSLDHIPDLSIFVGEKLTCTVQRVDKRGSGNIVLSRRDILQAERAKLAEELKTKLEPGQVLEGTVKKIMPFGAFVDIGGVDGLVHVSDLTHDRTGHGEKFVEKYVKPGQKVRVQIVKLDWENGKISLGMKQLEADPFAVVLSDIKEGAELTGRVTRATEFGAFVELSKGVEGLIHISELDHRRVNKVEDVVQKDQVVNVKVLKIDPESRRIALSIKALKPDPRAEQSKKSKQEKEARMAELYKEDASLRRLREKFGKQQLKGGF